MMRFAKTNPWWWNAGIFGVFLIFIYVGMLYFNTSIALRFSAALLIIMLFSITPFLGHKNWASRWKKVVRGKASWQKLVLQGFGMGLGLTVFRILANHTFGYTNVVRKELEMGAVLWLVIVLLSGFAEELYFRGYLMKNVVTQRGEYFPIGVQSAWFTAYHVASSQHLRFFDFPYYFICGIAFGILTMRDRCLFSAIVAHMVFNFAQFIIS